MGIGIFGGLLNEIARNDYFDVSDMQNHVPIGEVVDFVDPSTVLASATASWVPGMGDPRVRTRQGR
jgi:hypothetical protein